VLRSSRRVRRSPQPSVTVTNPPGADAEVSLEGSTCDRVIHIHATGAASDPRVLNDQITSAAIIDGERRSVSIRASSPPSGKR
jgi:hypothetical protein